MVGQRKTQRIFTRIPIRVRGQNQVGKSFSEDTTTVEIGRDGARIGLNNVPRFGAQLQITNLSNSLTAGFVVNQQCPQSYSGMPEWGLELSDPVPNFWDIAFEERKEEELAVSALLTCKTCDRREMASLSPLEYQELGETFSVQRQCSACGQVTHWEVVADEEEEPAAPSVATTGEAAPRATGAERRQARRLTLKAPILVTAANGASELTETQDLSKTGLSFSSSLEVECGAQVQVAVGFGVAESPSVKNCRVMWREPREKSVRYLYGVQFLQDT